MKKYVVILVLLVMVFSGCAPTYSIEPKFDEKNSTLDIGGKVIENVSLSIDNNSNVDTSFRFNRKNKKYVSRDDICSQIMYFHQTAGTKAYIWGNLEDLLKEDFTMKRDGQCLVEKISNVKFINCHTTTGAYKTFFGIETTESNQHGYSDIKGLFLERKCFFALLDHYKDVALKDKVDVEKYIIKTKDSLSSASKIVLNTYEGKFTYMGINDNCTESGLVKIAIEGNQITGSFVSNNKEIGISGKLNDNQLSGTFLDGSFSGRMTRDFLSISGTYNTNECYGKFELKNIGNK